MQKRNDHLKFYKKSWENSFKATNSYLTKNVFISNVLYLTLAIEKVFSFMAKTTN